ncbi:MAG: hypothetical protein PWP67_3063 [Clostridium butyricum]|nr:hypothetical protein [Petroclostridium sp.]MDK2830227.1 hypothetical protein [Clostridium butyricum]
MKILVTGANGYLGKGVVTKLLDNGYEVVATDIRDDYIDKRAEIICADLFSIVNPFEYFGNPDVLLHMSWRDGFVHSSMNHIFDLPKHVSFIHSMVEAGVKRIAVMGSMHEIGFYEGSIKEGTPCNPQSLYGISKNALRGVVELECKRKGIALQWLRGFYIVGNSQDGSSIFSKIVQAAHNGEQEFPFTLGMNQFDFLDYDLFCKYVADAITQEEIVGIINICNGRPEKLADRVERFIKENNLNIKLKYGAFPDRPYDSKAIWGDSFKISMIESLKEKRNEK